MRSQGIACDVCHGQLTMVSSMEQVMCTSLKVEYLHNRSADSSKSHIKMMLVIVATNNTRLCECCMHRVKIICWYMFTNVLCGDFFWVDVFVDEHTQTPCTAVSFLIILFDLLGGTQTCRVCVCRVKIGVVVAFLVNLVVGFGSGVSLVDDVCFAYPRLFDAIFDL